MLCRIFWAYDGSFRIGTPHRLYSEVVDTIIAKVGRSGSSAVSTSAKLAKVYAIVNVAMADAGARAVLQCPRWTRLKLSFCIEH
jgi:hypothetical protein